MKHISYPKIEQFRNIIATINRQSTFEGLSESGEAIYNPLLPKPILVFKGTVKLHGTNAGVSFNDKDGVWAQSRENIITPQKDNAAFAFFVSVNETPFLSLFSQLFRDNNIDPEIFTITIFGEWVGKGIQRGVAISNLEKSFFIFGAKVSHSTDESFKSYWIDSSMLHRPENNIFNIEDFPTYQVDIDFNMPQLVQNQIIDMTIAVENECPVGKHFGFTGTGEGIVFKAEYNGEIYRFKSKGEKHSVTKVKTLNSVNTEKLNSIADFVEYAVTQTRFDQAIEKVFGEEEVTIKRISDVMRWMINDIIAEESDTLSENNLEPKDIGKYVSDRVRGMFFKLLDSNAVK